MFDFKKKERKIKYKIQISNQNITEDTSNNYKHPNLKKFKC